MNSQRSSNTHCQAPQAQAQTNFCTKREQRQTCLTMPSKAKISEAKACQRVCLPQPSEIQIFLPLFKEKKIKHANTRATQTEKENEVI
jgi:hypothetical protein